MSDISVYSADKKEVGKVVLPKSFGEKPNRAILHQVVVAQQTNRRQGNAKVKTRHEVAGSTRKIIRQKGTGGARHGDIKAPLFVGGGQAFGPKPKDYEVSLPQKVRRLAMMSAVLDRKLAGKFWVIDQFSFTEPKTKKAAALFEKFGIEKGLVVLDQALPAVEKSIRNLAGFKVCRFESLNVLDIIRYPHLVLTRASCDKLVKNFGGEA